MSLVKKSSFPFFSDSMFDFIDKDAFFKREALPAVNIKENPDNFEIEALLPGMKKEDIHIGIENGILSISGEAKNEQESKDDKYTRKEFSYSSYKRSFSLPQNIKEEDIKASYENGILKLNIAKNKVLEQEKKKIQIS